MPSEGVAPGLNRFHEDFVSFLKWKGPKVYPRGGFQTKIPFLLAGKGGDSGVSGFVYFDVGRVGSGIQGG